VRQAIGAGFNTVHLAADHGFLLLEEVAEHGKASLPVGEWLKKSARYALTREPDATDHLRFPVAGGEELFAWYPHGAVCFKTPGAYNYVHGGPSLQEILLPHIEVRTSPMGTPVGVEIEADDEAHSAIFKIRLAPLSQGLISEEREIRLALEHEAGAALHTTEMTLEPGEPVVKSLRVTARDDVASGETLYITVYDAETAERLARHAIRFLVSLDF
jgi:hypothetical protein